MGEEELAVEEYQLAALHLIETRGEYYQAGDMLAQPAKRLNLALPAYQAGWNKRHANQAVVCAHRLLHAYASQEALGELKSLTAEAAAYFKDSAASPTSFFNDVAAVAERAPLAELREGKSGPVLCSAMPNTPPAALAELQARQDWTLRSLAPWLKAGFRP